LIVSQDKQDFMKHLFKAKQKIELLQFMKESYGNTDSSDYVLAKYYLSFQQDSSFLFFIQKSKTLFLTDTIALGYASCYLLKSDQLEQERKEWFREMQKKKNVEGINKMSDIFFLHEIKPSQIIVSNYPNLLQSSVKHYKQAAQKNPIKAACLSAVVPGLGKMYIGKYRIGLNAMFMNGVFAAQTYESMHKFGIKHPLSIVNIILSSLFYASTIYGSYRDTQYYKKENLEQLYHDASNYYSTVYYPDLF
jgi:hypothetical protein